MDSDLSSPLRSVCMHTQLCPIVCDPMNYRPSFFMSAQKSPPRCGLPWPFCRTWCLLFPPHPLPTSQVLAVMHFNLIFLHCMYHPMILSLHVCLIAQSCPILCDPLDYNPPGSSVHGFLQARILEWIAISSSRGSSRCRDLPLLCLLHWRQILYLLSHEGSPGTLCSCFILFIMFSP